MKTLIKNLRIINDGSDFVGHIVIEGEFINSISDQLPKDISSYNIIEGEGKVAIPGVIDDQVHFREPGLTYKGGIYSESRAAVAGGITSFMEMPNTNPQTTTQDALKQKLEIGAEKSFANYSFYLGATNDNLAEIIKTDPKNVCGIKVFMGASTGNMLVDDEKTLERIFSEAPCLIATHCEDETTIRSNLEKYKSQFGENILPKHHPLIRSEEACYISSSKAIELATKHGSKLHVLHLSTEKEMSLFSSGAIQEKKITAEVCVHHLWFDESYYEKLGNKIRWNPAIKKASDKDALLKALINDKLDVVATDHAPHTIDEKMNAYLNSASGGPLVQHSLIAMLEMANQNKIDLKTVVEKMCHAPAKLFQVNKRGYLKEGYYADIVLVDLQKSQTISSNNILYKCGWSPFEGQSFGSTITHTFINGAMVYNNGEFKEDFRGKALTFDR
ncbi:MAG: dihydroorotase [Salinivirgaceae bacterium]|jgi:dihydroorotase|nr:dihydroorotase [Salinivirgaceae bacterium]